MLLLVCDAADDDEELVVVEAVDRLVEAWNAVARLLISEGVRGPLAAAELLELVWGLAGELRPVTLVERRFCRDDCNGLVLHEEPEALDVGLSPMPEVDDCPLAPGDAGDGVTVDNCS